MIILNGNFTDVHEISLTKTKHCILYSLPYNNKVFNLMMAYIKAETCSCWDKLFKKPLSNINITHCVWLYFTHIMITKLVVLRFLWWWCVIATNIFFDPFHIQPSLNLIREMSVCVTGHIYLCIHVYYDDQIVRWKQDSKHIQASVQFHFLAVLIHRIYTDFQNCRLRFYAVMLHLTGAANGKRRKRLWTYNWINQL